VGSWRRLRAIGLALAGVFTAVAVVASASAAPAGTAHLSVNIFVGTNLRAPIIPRGDSTTVSGLKFKAGLNVESTGPDLASVRLRFELPSGLHWGDDLPDPGENCTSTASAAECHPPFPLDWNNPQMSGLGWLWDVVADAPGSYVLKAELVESSASDPEPADDSSSVAVVVKEAATAVTASAVKLSPAKPTAGSVMSARVAVSGATPTGVICAGAVGSVRVTGTGRATVGAATCRYRTPRTARGKTLRGSVSFVAAGTRITRRFTVKLH
jgi:hypothetical protein